MEYVIKKTSLNKLIQLLLLVAFFVLMNILYPGFLVEHYEYSGFTSDGITVIELLIAILLFGGSIFILFSIESSFLRIVSGVFQILFLIPNVILWMHKEYTIIPSLMVVLFMALLSWDMFRLPNLRMPILSIKEQSFVFILLSVIGFIPFAVIYDFHFDLSLFTFSGAIYEIREEVSHVNIPFLGYLLSPYVKVLLPMMIAYYLLHKRYWLGLVGVLLMILMFTLTPHKSIIFSAIVVLGFALIKKHDYQFTLLMSGIIVFILIGTVAAANGELMLNSLMVRRVFFLPAYLNQAYLDFFDGENLYYGYSFMSSFFDYPYPFEPASMIGLIYFGKESVNANSGFISDAVINLGYVGLFFMTVLVALIFRLFDSLNISAGFFGLYFLFIFTLLNSGLFTSMLTHGGFALILFSMIFLNQTAKSTSDNPTYDEGE
jgi:hypothetical protein